MNRTRRPGQVLTAADVMSRAPVTVEQRTTLRAASRAMARYRCHLLAVTDDQGRYVGTLTAEEVLRWVLEVGQHGGPNHDRSAWTEWQVMSPDSGRTDEVRWYLSPNPVVVNADTELFEVTRRLAKSRTCCAVVLDDRQRPVGILCGGDCASAVSTLSPLPLHQDAALAPSAGGRRPSRRPLAPVG